jgi:hypothetical protein
MNRTLNAVEQQSLHLDQSCPGCGYHAGVSIGPGKGPHAASIYCSWCGRFLKMAQAR